MDKTLSPGAGGYLGRISTRWRLISLAGAAAAIASLYAPEHSPRPPQPAPPASPPELAALPAAQPDARLPSRETLRGSADPFATRSWAPPPPWPPPARTAAPEPPPPPSAPPNPYRFAGTARYGGSLKAVLAAGDRVQAVRPGEVLDGVYQVVSISGNGVTLLYKPLGIEQRLAFAEDAGGGSALARDHRIEPSGEMAAVAVAPPSVAPASAASPFPPGSPLSVR